MSVRYGRSRRAPARAQESRVGLEADIDEHAPHLLQARFSRREVAQPHRRHGVRADDLIAAQASTLSRRWQQGLQPAERSRLVLQLAVEEIVGTDAVSAVAACATSRRRNAPAGVRGVFVYVGLEPNTTFLRGVLALDATGHIETDINMRTSARRGVRGGRHPPAFRCPARGGGGRRRHRGRSSGVSLPHVRLGHCATFTPVIRHDLRPFGNFLGEMIAVSSCGVEARFRYFTAKTRSCRPAAPPDTGLEEQVHPGLHLRGIDAPAGLDRYVLLAVTWNETGTAADARPCREFPARSARFLASNARNLPVVGAAERTEARRRWRARDPS